jgi:hypothetical protein
MRCRWQRDDRAFSGEQIGHGATDAACSAGDQRDLSLKSHCLHLLK